MGKDDFERLILHDYRLTTAEIIYRLPDHPSLLQTYIWQEMDLNPDFPQLKRFLEFWDKTLDGKVHSVCVTMCEDIRATTYKNMIASLKIH